MTRHYISKEFTTRGKTHTFCLTPAVFRSRSARELYAFLPVDIDKKVD